MNSPNTTEFEIGNPKVAGDLHTIDQVLAACTLPVPTKEQRVSFLVARKDCTICGCIGWERFGDIALLRSLAVADHARNQGIASHLVQAAITELKGQGVKEFYLLTETAAGFAERFGFLAIDRSSLPAQLQASTQINTGSCSRARSMRLVMNERL